MDKESVDVHIICTEKDQPGSRWHEKGSCKNRGIFDLVTWLGWKQCAVKIKNTDNLCFARAFLVAIVQYNATHTKTADSQRIYELLQKPDRPPQQAPAQLLHKEAMVPEGPCRPEEIRQFQRHIEMDGSRIIVISAKENFEKSYVGPKTCTKFLHLLLHNNHYDVITKPAALYNTSYYCTACMSNIKRIKEHSCKGTCRSC